MGERTDPKFSVGPFDSDRFETLTKGLSTSVINTSELSIDNPKLRFDSQFFDPAILDTISTLERAGSERIGQAAGRVLKGRSVSYSETGPVKIIRSGDISRSVNDSALLRADSEQPIFKLRDGDVLISSIGFGSIGKIHLFEDGEGYGTVSEVTVIRQSRVPPAYLAAFLSSRFGQSQIERQITGATGQLHLYPDDVGRVLFPANFRRLENEVADTFTAALDHRRSAGLHVADAEAVLLDALDLRHWSPAEPLTYARLVSDLGPSHRLDAEFAAPKIQALLAHLSRSGSTIGTVSAVRRQKFKPNPPGHFQYIEIGDLDGFGQCGSSIIDLADAPSRATWFVRSGDVITSTVRPIRRLSAIIGPEQDGSVCSSGFVVLQPTEVSAELLMTYLRLPLVAELMHLFSTASMYPALSESDLLALPMPEITKAVDEAVKKSVQSAAVAIRKSDCLLETAKCAVEIGIEESEDRGLAYIANRRS